VMAPDPVTHFDHYQSHNRLAEPLTQPDVVTLSRVYAFNPIPSQLPADQAAHILGAQGQLWTEYVPMTKLAEYQIFPRVCALAEDVWTPAGEKNYADFQARLSEHFRRLDELGVHYRHPKADDDQPTTQP
jgi:hexosaminidase